MPEGQRKLAAIMFTDMVGYTKLTQTNESIALDLLEKHNKIIRPILLSYNGTEVKTIGDSFLVEFRSALEAVQCGVELQKALGKFNESSAEKILVRVGIHVGDVVERGSDVFGDAVNIASRIEPLAKAGEVAISEQVYAQVRNKLDLSLSKLDVQELKNVAFPIEVYKIVIHEDEKLTSGHSAKNRIAVLPLSNISPDPNDEYFADGLTEELISKLSLVKGIKVIARTSVMKYKGKEKGISEIAKELGCGVLVEGSVRKAGSRIRVTIQVIDASSEEHLWSSSYDKNLDDIFSVQEDIASKVSVSLPASIGLRIPSGKTTDTRNVDAYTLYLKGMQLFYFRTDSSIRQALELFINATKLDPNFARAHLAIGRCYAELGVRSYISEEEASSGMKSAASKALDIDPNLAEVHSLLSYTAWGVDDFVTAESEARKAIELNPNLSEGYDNLSMLMLSLGYPKSGTELLRVSQELDPLSGYDIRTLGQMMYYSGRENEALDLWKRNQEVAPFEVHIGMATYYFGKRDYEKAELEVSEMERLSPGDFSSLCFRGYVNALKGDLEGTKKVINMLERTFKGGATLERNIGYMKYFLGDMDGFYEAMFRCAEARVMDPITLRYSPFFEKARRDSRYSDL
ncbi:MAG TPA: adenylate/guanylate cyclase domain-containing protein, partial [Nitrososphaerales archaeon]|nr:adenylate/guanylate cyclase domain-containing protein [Nitrososphaerales archaeon]